MALYRVGNHIVNIGVGERRSWAVSAPPPTYRAIVSVGESNAGGQAPTSSLSAPLQAPTSRIRILNVLTSVFQDLDIGANNNLDHDGLDSTTHGWEAGLIGYLDANPQTEPLYYIQTGQGGSGFLQWDPGGDGLTRAQSRIAAAISQFTTLGISPTWEIWLTLGINDFIGGSYTTTQYRDKMVTLIGTIRGYIGNGTATRVRTPEFMQSVKDLYPAYCAAHEELPGLVTNCQLIDTTGIPTQDAYHWSSAGYITLGGLLAAQT